MTRNDIIKMARQAHHELITQDYPGHAGQLDPWTMRLLERFAALVAAAEREVCAALLEANGMRCGEESLSRLILETNAAAIRARSNT